MKHICAFCIPALFLSASYAAEESGGVLEPYEITAYRFQTDALSTPVNSVKIDREAIEQSGAATVTEVLQKEGNVRFMSFTGGSGDGSVSMRGFGENSEMRVLVLVDGQRYNRPDMATIGWSQIPLANVESIEVLRGSQSAMYGNNAVAGVIKITRKKGAEENTARVNGMYGSYGLYTADASFSGREGSWFYDAGVSRFNDDGYRDNSAAWTESAYASVGYDFNEKTSLILSGNYSENYTEFAGALSWDDFKNNPRKGDPSQIYRHKGGVYSATLKSESAIGRGEVNFGLNFRDRDIQDNGFNGAQRTSWKHNDQWEFSISPRYEFDALEDWKFYTGLDANYADIRFGRDAWFASQRRRVLAEFAHVTRVDVGAYAGADYSVTEDFSMTLSGRAEAARTAARNTRYQPYSLGWPNPIIDRANSYDQDVWTAGLAGSYGLNYRITKAFSVYARFDQVYRYPTTDEIAFYQGATQAGGFPFNRDLNPEQGQNYEVGVKFIDKKWNAGANFFTLFLHNEIMYDYNRRLNINADPTLRYGLDFNLSYDDEVWGAYATATLVRAEFYSGQYDGKRIPLVPEFNTTAAIWVKPLENVRLLGRMNYSASQIQGNDFENARRKIPDYVSFDIQADFKLCRYASVFFAVENIADSNYATYAYNDGFYPVRGRTFKFGLNLKY